MSKLLVLYATIEGHSAKIADHIAANAVLRDFEVVEVNLEDLEEVDEASLPDCDAVILIASVHLGKHSRKAAAFARENRNWLAERASAFLSVSLSAASESEESRAAARAMLEEFLTQADWKPDLASCVAGALAYSQYGFVKRQILKSKARAEGGPTDTTQDFELTDWAALSAEIDGFLLAARDLNLGESVRVQPV